MKKDMFFKKSVFSVSITKAEGVVHTLEKGRFIVDQSGKETSTQVADIKIKGDKIFIAFSNGDKVIHSGYPYTAVHR